MKNFGTHSDPSRKGVERRAIARNNAVTKLSMITKGAAVATIATIGFASYYVAQAFPGKTVGATSKTSTQSIPSQNGITNSGALNNSGSSGVSGVSGGNSGISASNQSPQVVSGSTMP